MARSRNIKPGFFTNDTLAELDALTRLLFIGIWTIADRAGRLEDRPKRIKAEVLPYDDCNVDSMLSALERHGFILRYEANGVHAIQVVNWDKHQNPHMKEAESTIPAPCLHSAGTKPAGKPEQPNPEQAGLIPDSGFRIPDPLTSDPIGSAAVAATETRPVVDVKHQVFAVGVTLLTSAGVTDKNARSFLAAQCKAHPYARVLDALKACAAERAIQPVPWIVAYLDPVKGPGLKTTPSDRRAQTIAGLTNPGAPHGRDHRTVDVQATVVG